jgi:hypothetical protein
MNNGLPNNLDENTMNSEMNNEENAHTKNDNPNGRRAGTKDRESDVGHLTSILQTGVERPRE